MKFLTDVIAVISEQENVPPSFQPLANFRLILMVGLTAVGKSTIVEHLLNEAGFTLLPNRRVITDEIIIGSLQKADGEPPHIVTDRVKRFEYTARYRAKHPGGMAYALSRLVVKQDRAGPMLLFDGLRGLNEVQHAASYFFRARFIVLDAPDTVRLSRLLKRGDSFDTANIETSPVNKNLIAKLEAIPNIETVFSQDQLLQIVRATQNIDHSVDEVVGKAAIIVEERSNYDPHRARVFLSQKLPPGHVLVVDTSIHSPRAVAEQAREWLGGGS